MKPAGGSGQPEASLLSAQQHSLGIPSSVPASAVSQSVAIVPHWQQWGSERGAVSEGCVGGPGPGQLSSGAIWAQGCPASLPHLPFVLTGRRGRTHHPKAPQGQPRELLPCGRGPHSS